MIEIRNLAQGADYTIEIPFTLDDVAISSAIAVQFDILKSDTVVVRKNLCNGLTLQPGLIKFQLTNADTLNLAGNYDCELWIIPATEPNKKNVIDTGRIHFNKTNSRITPCL